MRQPKKIPTLNIIIWLSISIEQKLLYLSVGQSHNLGKRTMHNIKESTQNSAYLGADF